MNQFKKIEISNILTCSLKNLYISDNYSLQYFVSQFTKLSNKQWPLQLTSLKLSAGIAPSAQVGTSASLFSNIKQLLKSTRNFINFFSHLRVNTFRAGLLQNSEKPKSKQKLQRSCANSNLRKSSSFSSIPLCPRA